MSVLCFMLSDNVVVDFKRNIQQHQRDFFGNTTLFFSVSAFNSQSGYITDATVAVLLGFLFFIVPAYGPSKKYGILVMSLKISIWYKNMHFEFRKIHIG